jgi:hypothetical protein
MHLDTLVSTKCNSAFRYGTQIYSCIGQNMNSFEVKRMLRIFSQNVLNARFCSASTVDGILKNQRLLLSHVVHSYYVYYRYVSIVNNTADRHS